jgi:hypothetical protein
MADKVAKQGHERRTEPGPERRPSKAPEIMRIEMLGRELVTRVLAINPLPGPDPEAVPAFALLSRNGRKPHARKPNPPASSRGRRSGSSSCA